MAPKKSAKLSGNALSLYLNEISKIPQITPEREKELGRHIQAGDEEALHKLVEANLRFVVAYAKKYRNGPLSLTDLIEEGNLGLIEAAKRFDPDKGVKFITYAAWWIRQSLIHALGEQGRTIRLPQRQASLLYQIGRSIGALKSVLNRSPSTEEIASKMGITTKQADELLRFSGKNISLDSALGGDSHRDMKDLMAQETEPAADLELIRKSFESQVREMVDQLSPRERIVVQERFGLLDDEPKTLQQIGEMLGVTRERVRQIEQKAINKLRHSVRAHKLYTYLN